MEFLKDILGDELYNAVEQALAEREDVKLANLASGAYVGKEKFLAAMDKISTLEAELAKSAQTISTAQESAKKAAELESAIAALTQEKEQMGRQYEENLAKERLESAVKNALGRAKVRNMKAVRALLDESQVALENGELTGLSEQLSRLKQSDPYLFEMLRDTGGGTNPTMSATDALKRNPDKLDDSTFYKLKFDE